MANNDKQLSAVARIYQEAGPWLSAVWQFTGSTLVLVAVGYFVDRKLGTKPWGLVVGGLVGSAVGFYAFIRATNRLIDAKKKQGP